MILLFVLSGLGFAFLRRYLALKPSQIGRACRLLEMVGEGSPGHGQIHLLSASASEIGFRWDPLALGWSRLGLPLHSNLAGPVQRFNSRLPFLMLGVMRLPLIFAVGKVFGVVRCWMCMALCSSLTLLMSGKQIRLCFEVLRLVVFGMVSYWAGFVIRLFLAGSAVPLMVMVIFWDCTFPPLVEIGENPEFRDLM